MLSKEACDSGRGIELRGTCKAVALPLVDLDLIRGALLPQQTLYRVSMGDGDDAIRSTVQDQSGRQPGTLAGKLMPHEYEESKMARTLSTDGLMEELLQLPDD
ncbi:hypothetical protein Mchl_0083 [Methylorubrum extorquens CM4]|uniref:Uncharacterized protein n=1 Tax=Methylorubrum extorquens (strain CM4 / NCIMB 13688) TaxID=440085 RepID=B7L1E5_METC4|nr:hypothetical protein Mchl_0083 [Methylorubrum extorquens CM4]